MALLRRPEGVALSREECIHMALESVSSLPSRSWSLRRRALTPYLFILPFGLLFLLFFIVPILYAVYESLFRSQRSGLGLGAATVSFTSLGNYVDVLHDVNFYSGVGRVLIY